MQAAIYLLLIFLVLTFFLTQSESFQLGSCYGRTQSGCLSDINCEWNPYFNLCQGRTYNAGLSDNYGWNNGWYSWNRPYYRYPWTRNRIYANRRPSWVYW